MPVVDPIGAPLAANLSRPERVFPTLTEPQIARIAPHGRRRPITSGEVLIEAGQQPVPFFVDCSSRDQLSSISLSSAVM